MTAPTTEGTLPTVVEFGGQRSAVEPAADSSSQSGDLVSNLTGLVSLDRDSLPRIVLSLLGTLVVIAGMIVMGAVIYLLFLRRPQQQMAPAYPTRTPTTGGLKPVPMEALDVEDDVT